MLNGPSSRTNSFIVQGVAHQQPLKGLTRPTCYENPCPTYKMGFIFKSIIKSTISTDYTKGSLC